MKYELDMQDSYFSGYSVGEAKGRKERIICFHKYLTSLNFDNENAIKTIASSFDIPEAEIKKIISNSSNENKG